VFVSVFGHLASPQRSRRRCKRRLLRLVTEVTSPSCTEVRTPRNRAPRNSTEPPSAGAGHWDLQAVLRQGRSSADRRCAISVTLAWGDPWSWRGAVRGREPRADQRSSICGASWPANGSSSARRPRWASLTATAAVTLLVTLAARKASSGRSVRLSPRVRYPAAPSHVRSARGPRSALPRPARPPRPVPREQPADGRTRPDPHRAARMRGPPSQAKSGRKTKGPLPAVAHGQHQHADVAASGLHAYASPLECYDRTNGTYNPVRASLGTHRRALTPRVSPQQERGASLVMAWACADTGESVPGFGPNSEGRAAVAGAVPAPRYGGPLRMARDTDAAYGSRIADRRGRLIEG
jgi:hypothetical protein